MARPKSKNTKRDASKIEANKVKNREQAKRRRLRQKSIVSQSKKLTNAKKCKLYRQRKKLEKLARKEADIEAKLSHREANIEAQRIRDETPTAAERNMGPSMSLEVQLDVAKYNSRKELKKIENSKRLGRADEVYKPTSSTFHQLQFLANIEKPKLIKDNGSDVRSEEDNSLVISSITNGSPPVKIRKNSGTTKQNLLNRACSLVSLPAVSSQDVNPLALVWSDKLNSLNPTQKLYAEKAIHDILFEAQLNNLHRHSVQINASATDSSPATSARYPYTDHDIHDQRTPTEVVDGSTDEYQLRGGCDQYKCKVEFDADTSII